MEVEVAAVSDIGSVRDNNEDNLYHNGMVKEDVKQPNYAYKGVDEIKPESAYAVFDGMGGLPHGELASLTAGKILGKIMAKEPQMDYEEVIRKLNHAVCKQQKKYRSPIGSTAAILFFTEYGAVSVNVGDSRIYLLHEGKLGQLTKDHTERNSAMEMQAALGDSYEINMDSIRDALTQHLGIKEREFILEPEIKRVEEIKEGDIFLLCSDGLWNYVGDEEIKRVLSEKQDLFGMAEKLRNMALEAEGRDNITIILLKIR